MKLSALTLLGVALLSFSTGCSTLKPFKLEADKSAEFTPNDWNGRKQNFIQESTHRVSDIAADLRKLEEKPAATEYVDEAKEVLVEVTDELKQLKYASVRDWESEKDDFISTMNDLEEKFEKARNI